MTAWMARLGFLLMFAAIPCLAAAGVVATQTYMATGHVGTGYLAWQLGVIPAVGIGALLVHVARRARNASEVQQEAPSRGA